METRRDLADTVQQEYKGGKNYRRTYLSLAPLVKVSQSSSISQNEDRFASRAMLECVRYDYRCQVDADRKLNCSDR